MRSKVDGFDDESRPLRGERLDCAGGYAASKQVAETALRSAPVPRGCVTITRPGTVTGHSVGGEALQTDMSCRLLVAFATLRCVPSKDALGGLELLPVDQVASFIVSASLDPVAVGRTFNLAVAAPVSLGAVVQALRTFGYTDTRAVYFGEFKEKFQAAAAAGRSDALTYVASHYAAHDRFVGKMKGEVSCPGALEVAARNGLEIHGALVEEDSQRPLKLLTVYLQWLVKAGLIENPNKAPTHQVVNSTASA